MGNITFASQELRYPSDLPSNPEPILINPSANSSERVCLATLGNSHTDQHLESLRDLALRNNASMAVLSNSHTELEFSLTNSPSWDSWRLAQLQQLQPRIVFTQLSIESIK